ncbi:hypothetical protein [Planobispora longispora]|uniref:Uncharacterized protein n=1 Tax=Planobispora longispora TaxID=28887 RepID=A0A8J3RQ87_9ACTN|nr:hypothetical protein [Planobispora longispora]BFE87793.1 hypothetical protein GCM10020093_103940 [Planobispora longispora]GIH77679.1 hypothetical protein Plo01_41080 [Planobispora longispora]
MAEEAVEAGRVIVAPVGRYHSHHVGVLQAEHERIDWRVERPRADRVRVREHTCDCRATFYELCQAGGLMFVRRTHRAMGKTAVHESPWAPAKETQKLWLRLLMGGAR